MYAERSVSCYKHHRRKQIFLNLIKSITYIDALASCLIYGCFLFAHDLSFPLGHDEHFYKLQQNHLAYLYTCCVCHVHQFAYLSFQSNFKIVDTKTRLIGLVILRPHVEVEMRDFETPSEASTASTHVSYTPFVDSSKNKKIMHLRIIR